MDLVMIIDQKNSFIVIFRHPVKIEGNVKTYFSMFLCGIPQMILRGLYQPL